MEAGSHSDPNRTEEYSLQKQDFHLILTSSLGPKEGNFSFQERSHPYGATVKIFLSIHLYRGFSTSFLFLFFLSTSINVVLLSPANTGIKCLLEPSEFINISKSTIRYQKSPVVLSSTRLRTPIHMHVTAQEQQSEVSRNLTLGSFTGK
jgi:hypothetical protein